MISRDLDVISRDLDVISHDLDVISRDLDWQESTSWAVGDGGTILQTDDRGLSWRGLFKHT